MSISLRNSFLCSLLLLSTIVVSKNPDIKEWDGDRYIQDFGRDYFYIVDKKAQSCFLSFRAGLTVIDCSKLAKREKWKEVITWIKKDS